MASKGNGKWSRADKRGSRSENVTKEHLLAYSDLCNTASQTSVLIHSPTCISFIGCRGWTLITPTLGFPWKTTRSALYHSRTISLKRCLWDPAAWNEHTVFPWKHPPLHPASRTSKWKKTPALMGVFPFIGLTVTCFSTPIDSRHE